MPCAKINISYDIFKTFNKTIEGNTIKFCGKTLIIPIVSLGTTFPFKPKGILIGKFIIHSNIFKKITKKKFQKIIQNYNRIIETEYICDNNKNIIENKLIDDIEMFINYINISMDWEDNDFNNYKICIHKEDYWEYF
tara:strand:+ start:161 stop:571 length:411 start_codon:yes stop_codon:yes gene_type:complete